MVYILQVILLTVLTIYILRAITLLKSLLINFYSIISIGTKVKNFTLTLAINIVLQEVVIMTTLYVLHLAYTKGLLS